MDLMPFAIVATAALVGSIPFGLILDKHFLNVDLQTMGSGNIGATNAARAGGKAFGAGVLVLDALKGFFGPWLASFYGLEPPWIAAAGMAAVLGHCYTPFLGFRGGKGVATSLGVILAYDPALGGVGVVTYALVLAVTRVSALGSLSATLFCVAAAWLWPGEQFDLSIRLTLIAICVLIVWRHRSNLSALRQKKVDEKA